MVNEFEEFARQFRERTMTRMLEFEASLAQAQQQVERAVSGERRREGAVEKRKTQDRNPGRAQSVLRRRS